MSVPLGQLEGACLTGDVITERDFHEMCCTERVQLLENGPDISNQFIVQLSNDMTVHNMIKRIHYEL
jgi:hypothetical protein